LLSDEDFASSASRVALLYHYVVTDDEFWAELTELFTKTISESHLAESKGDDKSALIEIEAKMKIQSVQGLFCSEDSDLSTSSSPSLSQSLIKSEKLGRKTSFTSKSQPKRQASVPGLFDIGTLDSALSASKSPPINPRRRKHSLSPTHNRNSRISGDRKQKDIINSTSCEGDHLLADTIVDAVYSPRKDLPKVAVTRTDSCRASAVETAVRLVEFVRVFITVYTHSEFLRARRRYVKDFLEIAEMHSQFTETAKVLLQKLNGPSQRGLTVGSTGLKLKKTKKKQGGRAHNFDSITSFEPEQAACYLTLRSWRKMKRISPSVMFNCRFSKIPEDTDSITDTDLLRYRRATLQSRQVCNVMQAHILVCSDRKERVAAMQWWLRVAKHCFSLNNFSDAMNVVFSLETTAIYRLRNTWKILPPNDKEMCDELKEVFSPLANFTKYRQVLTGKACIPALNVAARDCIYLHEMFQPGEGVPARLADNLIEVFSVLLRAREVDYSHLPTPPPALKNQMNALMEAHQDTPEEFFYDLSCSVEPSEMRIRHVIDSLESCRGSVTDITQRSNNLSASLKKQIALLQRSGHMESNGVDMMLSQVDSLLEHLRATREALAELNAPPQT